MLDAARAYAYVHLHSVVHMPWWSEDQFMNCKTLYMWWNSGEKKMFLLLWLLYYLISIHSADTQFECAGSTVALTCAPGYYISIVRGNYGRFSISVCNHQARELDTHCGAEERSTLTLRKMWVGNSRHTIHNCISYVPGVITSAHAWFMSTPAFLQ